MVEKYWCRQPDQPVVSFKFTAKRIIRIQLGFDSTKIHQLPLPESLKNDLRSSLNRRQDIFCTRKIYVFLICSTHTLQTKVFCSFTQDLCINADNIFCDRLNRKIHWEKIRIRTEHNLRDCKNVDSIWENIFGNQPTREYLSFDCSVLRYVDNLAWRSSCEHQMSHSVMRESILCIRVLDVCNEHHNYKSKRSQLTPSCLLSSIRNESRKSKNIYLYVIRTTHFLLLLIYQIASKQCEGLSLYDIHLYWRLEAECR